MHSVLKLLGCALSPLVVSLPFAVLMNEYVPTAIAQESDNLQKAEGDRLQQQGIELSRNGKPEAALQLLQQALTLYRNLKDQAGEGSTLRYIGNAYSDLKDYPKALEYQQQALAIAQVIKDHNLEARALNNIGLAYENLKDSTKAIKFYQKSLAISEQYQNNEMQAITSNNVGNLFKILKKYEQAAQFYKKSVQSARKGEFFEREITALNNLGDLYLEFKDYPKSLDYYRASLHLARSHRNQSAERDAFFGIGKAYKRMGKLIQSVDSLQKVLLIAQKQGNQELEMGVRGMIATSYLDLGEVKKAIDYYQQNLDLAQKRNNKLVELFSTQGLGLAYRFLEDSAKAIDYFQRSFNIAKETNNLSGQLEALQWMGIQYEKVGQYNQSLTAYEQALDLVEKTGNTASQKHLSLLSNLSSVYVSLANFPQAIKISEKALNYAHQTNNQLGKIQALNDLGAAHQLLDPSRAINYYHQGLQLADLDRDKINQARALIGLGESYILKAELKAWGKQPQRLAIQSESLDKNKLSSFSLKSQRERYHDSIIELNQAIKYAQESLKILENINDVVPQDRNIRKLRSLMVLIRANTSLGEAPFDYLKQSQDLIRRSPMINAGTKAANLSIISSVYTLLGEFEKAQDLLRQSIELSQDFNMPIIKVKALSMLGINIYYSQQIKQITIGKPKDFSEAEDILYEAISGMESLRGSLASRDELKVSIFEEQQSTFRTLEEVLISRNKTEEALEITERGRARAFVELLLSRSNLGSIINIEVVKPNAKQIRQISKEQNATLVIFSLSMGNYLGIQTSGLTSIYSWVVKPTGEITFRQVRPDSIAANSESRVFIENLVTVARKAIGVRGRSDIEIAASIDPKDQPQKLRQLHQLLIEPIADLLPTNPSDRVVFMPQGSLFLVPFPALQDANGKYLIEKHTILTAPSIQVLQQTRQLKATRSATPGKSKALVLGNPIMPKVALSPGRPPQPLTPLPGAEREAIAIAPLLNTQPIIGSQATKAAIVQKMPQANIIHLATHGLLDDQRGLGSAIALAPDPTQPEDRFGRSNGLLTAEEILDMQLNADLVVLSACDTGRGRITGDGVIGLSRSFITAGVPSVIVSLWAVPDAPTAELMTEFYKNWKERNLDKAQALRQAMLTTMKTHPNPRDWAAFTLIGEAE